MQLARHLQVSSAEIGKYVLLPGDPGRCEVIAAFLDEPRFVTSNREFTTFTGMINKHWVSVTSTGIGCPSTAIAIEELASLGAHTFIRVGTAGGMQSKVRLGDLVITCAAVRHEGTSQQYMPLAYPAIADLEVTLALRQAARNLGRQYHVGISHSKDSFYGEVNPDRMPIAAQLRNEWNAWIQGGVLCSEMEAATLFTVARILKCRAGGVMLVAGLARSLQPGESARLTEEERLQAVKALAQTSVEAVRLLIETDNLVGCHPP